MNVQSHDASVGFNVRNIDSLPQSYLCQSCMRLLRDPRQLECGHRYCRLCLDTTKDSILKCMKCHVETARDKIIVDRGCQKDMEKLQILCSCCEWNGVFRDYSEHLSTTHIDPSCQYCNRKFADKNSLIAHQSECENMIIHCQLNQYGCTEQFLRQDTRNHLLSGKHQSIMLDLLSRTMPSLMNNQQSTTVPKDYDLSHATTTSLRTPNDHPHQTIDVLLSSIQVLNDDTQQLSSKALRTKCLLEYMTTDLSKLKMAVEETNAVAVGLEPNQQILRQDLDALSQDIEDQQAVSHDGTLLWRITNVQKKLADGQSEQQTSIYSPPFYSSPNGYKMRARLYLYGDGNARRTHLSLFFVLMRGKHDAILSFPFNYKVSFCLYDQTGQQGHFIDSFRPDIKSASFQRPRTDMNIASGLPKFLPLTTIQQDNNPYVRDDTMFIKVMVHFKETAKTLLPYIFSINPGLTSPVHESLIKQQIEKRAQKPAITNDVLVTPSSTLNSSV